jgi:hypothetical protein
LFNRSKSKPGNWWNVPSRIRPAMPETHNRKRKPMSVLTAIRERFGARQADADQQYLKAVSDAAAGRDSDPATLANVLTAAGRTQEQFIVDVEKIERRAAARLKLAEAEKLRPSAEAASKESLASSAAVDAAREQARKIVDDALDVLREKSDAAGQLSRRIQTLEMTAHQDLMSTADPSLQAQIDQLEASIRDIRERQKPVGRSPGCDPDEAMASHQRAGSDIAKLEERIEELRLQQLA